MIETLQKTLQRIDEFSDSFELAETLNEMGDDGEAFDGPTRYVMKECAVHIESLYVLCLELARHAKTSKRFIH